MWTSTWTSILVSLQQNVISVRQQANVCGSVWHTQRRGCVLTMFAECFHTQRRISSSVHRGKSAVRATGVNASDTWAVGPAELPLQTPVQKSSLLITQPPVSMGLIINCHLLHMACLETAIEAGFNTKARVAVFAVWLEGEETSYTLFNDLVYVGHAHKLIVNLNFRIVARCW